MIIFKISALENRVLGDVGVWVSWPKWWKECELLFWTCFSEHVLVRSGRLLHPPHPQHHLLHQTGQVLQEDGHGGRLRRVSLDASSVHFLHLMSLKMYLASRFFSSIFPQRLKRTNKYFSFPSLFFIHSLIFQTFPPLLVLLQHIIPLACSTLMSDHLLILPIVL